jgi:xanthine dehydrogenase accessory factor
MTTLIDCFEKALREPRQNWVIATVIKTSGSVPQRVGASMLVSKSGVLFGTVGGGLMENKCIEKCMAMAGSRSTFVFSLTMNENYALEAGPICGGKIHIHINPTLNNQTALLTHVTEYYQQGTPLWLSLNQQTGVYEIHQNPSASNTDEQVLTLKISAKNQLLVLGSGHCGAALAELAGWLGFDTHLIDPRPIDDDISDVAYHQKTFDEFLENFRITHNTAIVLVNKGHKEDALALKPCLHSDAKYIGMIGSKRKVKLLKQAFIENQWATEEQWNHLHAPIGIELGVSEVKSIAVSIMSEILAVFNLNDINRPLILHSKSL